MSTFTFQDSNGKNKTVAVSKATGLEMVSHTLTHAHCYLYFHLDYSNCGRAHIHCIERNSVEHQVDFEEIFQFLSNGRLPFHPSSDDASCNRSIITMSGNYSSRVVEFAKWCSEHHPNYIHLCPVTTKNKNSGSQIYEALFYPYGSYIEAVWDKVDGAQH